MGIHGDLCRGPRGWLIERRPFFRRVTLGRPSRTLASVYKVIVGWKISRAYKFKHLSQSQCTLVSVWMKS